jgi:hypothetical protein
VPEPSLVEMEIATGKLNSYKSPGTGQIPAKLIKAGGETLSSEIHRLVLYGIRRNCHRRGKSITIQIYKRG